MNTYETQHYLFNFVNNLMLTLLVISYIGIWRLAPQYLEMLRTITQLYISLFLIIRFNPYASRPNFSELDRKVAFSAGMFLFATTIISKYLANIIEKTPIVKEHKETAGIAVKYVL